jgi:hypothetical protein
MWFCLGPIEDLLTEKQKRQVVARGQALMRRSLTGRRRSRTNPRAVRQPVTRWPRLMQTNSVEVRCNSKWSNAMNTRISERPYLNVTLMSALNVSAVFRSWRPRCSFALGCDGSGRRVTRASLP